MNDRERQFVERARASLDERAVHLEPHLASRLRAARHRALEMRQPRTHYGWMSAAATALVMVMAVGIWFTHDVGQQADSVAELPHAANPADLAMLARVDDPQVFQDLDFYRWLAQQEQSSS
ncbi:MAG: DUF3619 family protein [Pseudomonadota bacterium]|nr:DUF3619 family protein [Pseudomonadota bacterium]